MKISRVVISYAPRLWQFTNRNLLMAKNQADSSSGTSFGTENEDLVNANAPFEIPGLFSEFEGVTSGINTPFQASSQFSSFNAMLDESVPDTSVTA